MKLQLLVLLLAFSLLSFGCADAPDNVPCPATLACDDGLSCTVDTCDSLGQACAWELKADQCLIDGACYASGEAHPTNACWVCQPGLDPRAWRLMPNGTACNDGNACIAEARCSEGACDAPALPCDDGNTCTSDVCDPDEGCSHSDVEWGAACDDGDLCSLGEHCQLGACGGAVLGCDDSDPCTDDTCDPDVGCVHAANDLPCGDGGPCKAEGACIEGTCVLSDEDVDCDDGNPCTIDLCDAGSGCIHLPDAALTCDDGDPCTLGDACQGGACVGEEAAPCDDGNTCTVDACEAGAGCVHEPSTGDACCTEGVSICDDGDACTVDECIADTLACVHSESSSECDDGDACTGGDSCEGGVCAGVSLDCDDASPCTADSCDAELGCVYEPLSDLDCDDGLACSTGDTCQAGICTPAFSDCLCTPDFHEDSVKVMSLTVAEGDSVGFDLDQDGVVDNTLSGLASMVNDSIVESVESGELILLMEFRGPISGTSQVAMYRGDLSPGDLACDFQKMSCDYLVDPAFLVPVDGLCTPLVGFDIVIDGTSFSGGGAGTDLPFQLPLGDGLLAITLKDVQVAGTLVMIAGDVVGLTGMMGGVIPEQELVEALEGLPEDALGDSFTPQQVIGLLSLLVDIDTNGDGEDDAVSVTLLVEAIDGHIVGYQ